jgi:hypothetical protein
MKMLNKHILFFEFILALVISLPAVPLLATAQNNPATSQPHFPIEINSPNPDQLKIRAEALDSITSLLDLDISRYNVTLIKDILLSPQIIHEDQGLTLENLEYNLTSPDGRGLELIEQFSGGSIVYCHIDYYGNSTKGPAAPYYLHDLPSSLSEKTALMLNRLINFKNAHNQSSSTIQLIPQMLGNISLDQMLDTLNTATDGPRSVSVNKDNIKIEVQVNNVRTEVSFVPSYGGIDYPGKISIDFSNAGDLNILSDTSNIYKIGNTSINISRDEAINMAWNIATNKTSVHIVGVGDVIIQFVKNPWVNLEGSVRDNMTAFPLYSIRIPTDKTYYTMEGVEVGIWADNGQVAYSSNIGFEGQPIPNGQVLPSSTPESSSSAPNQPSETNAEINANILLIIIGVAFVASITVAAFLRKKHQVNIKKT